MSDAGLLRCSPDAQIENWELRRTDKGQKELWGRKTVPVLLKVVIAAVGNEDGVGMALAAAMHG
jgi:hypothetical protein